MRLNFGLLDKNDVVVFSSSSHLHETVDKASGNYDYTIVIPKNLLNHGMYKIAIQAGIPGQRQILENVEVLSFNIEKINNAGTTYNAVLPGVVAPKIDWTVEKH